MTALLLRGEGRGWRVGSPCLWMREGCARLTHTSSSGHIFEAGLQSSEKYRDFRPPANLDRFAEVCVGDGCLLLSLSSLLS